MSTKFCSKCGAKLRDNVKFCGSCGQSVYDEPGATSQLFGEGIVLKLPVPISSERPPWRNQAYVYSVIAGIVLLSIGVGVNSFILVAIGIFSELLVPYWTKDKDNDSMRDHLDVLRKTKFKFVCNVDMNDVYLRLKPALKEQYGDDIKFDVENGLLSITFKKTIHDLVLNDDATFCLYWHKTIGRAFTETDATTYNTVREGIGIIAYELQKQFNITQ